MVFTIFFKRIKVISVKNRITCKDIVPYTLFLNNDMKLYSHIIIPKLMKIENSNSPKITYNGHYYSLNYEVKINEKLFNELYTRSMISKVCSMLLGCIWNMGLWDIIILFTLA